MNLGVVFSYFYVPRCTKDLIADQLITGNLEEDCSLSVTFGTELLTFCDMFGFYFLINCIVRIKKHSDEDDDNFDEMFWNMGPSSSLLWVK